MALDAVIKPHQLIASDRIEGTAVRRPNGEMIGHIERLMIDKVSGQVSYAVMSSGGFLGMGARLLPLPWGRMRYSPRFDAYELDIDEDELRSAPSFRADADFDWGDRSQEAELHRYYGIPPIGAAFERFRFPALKRARGNTCRLERFLFSHRFYKPGGTKNVCKIYLAGLAASAIARHRGVCANPERDHRRGPCPVTALPIPRRSRATGARRSWWA